MNQILYSERSTSNLTKKIGIALIVLVIILIITIGIMSNILNDKILANVYVGDVNVGMQTKEEAKESIINEAKSVENSSITLVLNGKSQTFTMNELGFDVEKTIDTTVNSAFEYGRDGNFFGNSASVVKSYFNDNYILLSVEFDEDLLNLAISKITENNDEVAKDDSYEISGDKIIVHKGHNGNKVDIEESKKYISMALVNGVSNVELPTFDSDREKVDFKKIYDEIYKEAVDAKYVSGDSFKVIDEIPGKYFEIAGANEVYKDAGDGTSFEIEIKTSNPSVTKADIERDLFKNVLATFSNTYDVKDTQRVQNLKVAAERCNGKILYPGDEFSYNKALGTRTVANGFAPGHSFAGGKVVTTIGGGICQVSSAIYNIVLMADLEVTNRVAHGMYVGYVEPSLDATVVDGAIDFKFKNNRKYPVKLEAKVENGVVTVTLYGMKEENEPIIEIESVVLETIPYKTVTEKDSTMKVGTTKVVQDPVDGYVSEAYRIEKDKDGNIISRTLISKDRYIATNKIVKVGTKPNVVATPVPTPVITPTPVPSDDNGLPPGWDSPESPYGRGEY